MKEYRAPRHHTSDFKLGYMAIQLAIFLDAIEFEVKYIAFDALDWLRVDKRHKDTLIPT